MSDGNEFEVSVHEIKHGSIHTYRTEKDMLNILCAQSKEHGCNIELAWNNAPSVLFSLVSCMLPDDP